MKNVVPILLILSIIIFPTKVFSDVTNISVTVSIFECNDGSDNDGDSLTDYPNDPGCESLNDNDETDPPTQCEDGLDNDGDFFVDYPDDLGCSSVDDDDESTLNTSSLVGGGGGGSDIRYSNDYTANVELSGIGYPFSTVYILKDGKEVIQTITGGDGLFSTEIENLRSGRVSLSVYSRNDNGKSPLFTFPVNLNQGTKTSIGNIFLAPDFKIDKRAVKQGDAVVFYGQTAPNSNLNIEVNSESKILTSLKTDDSGKFSISIDTSSLEFGDHTANSVAVKNGLNSLKSSILNFRVGLENVKAVIEKNITQIIRGDFNNDNRINLVDFSIASFWYRKDLDQNMIEKEREIFNGDKKIDLIDFSIMAANWTG